MKRDKKNYVSCVTGKDIKLEKATRRTGKAILKTKRDTK